MLDLLFPVSLIWACIAPLLTYFKTSWCYPRPKNCMPFDQNSLFFNILHYYTTLFSKCTHKEIIQIPPQACCWTCNLSASLNASKSLFPPYHLKISCHCLQTQYSFVPQNTTDGALYSTTSHFHLFASNKRAYERFPAVPFLCCLPIAP